MREIVKFLKDQGIRAEAGSVHIFTVYGEVQSPSHFRVKDGVIRCTREDKLNLADPTSLQKLVKVVKHCTTINEKCENCPIGGPRKSDEIGLGEYEWITYACQVERQNWDCDAVCGKLGRKTCPFK